MLEALGGFHSCNLGPTPVLSDIFFCLMLQLYRNHPLETGHVKKFFSNRTVDGRNPANQLIGKYSLSHCLPGFCIPGRCLGFLPSAV